MKQKFTITVSDIEMNILSEGTPQEVEAITNKVDRRIREICLHSPSISKNEAALLCALEFCSERDMIQKKLWHDDKEFDTLKAKNAELSDALEKLEAKYEEQEEKYESEITTLKARREEAETIQKEKFEGRVQFMKEKYEARIGSLKVKLDDYKKNSAPKQIQMEIAEVNAADLKKDEKKDEGKAPEAATVEAEAVAEQPDALAEKKEMRGKGKNKVGSMFELLTFNDV